MTITTDINKWNSLLAQTTIKYESYDGTHKLTGAVRTSTSEDLARFEAESEILLPHGYKEFCQVFGDGEFGYTQFAVNIPGQKEDQDIITVRTLMIETYCDTKELDPSGNIKYISQNALSRIENSYRFGTGQGYLHFIFDLTSYSETNLSYDIYAVKCDSNPSITFLGRDFFYFIKNYCLSNRLELSFPHLLGVEYDEDDDDPISQSGTFFPCFLYLESDKSEELTD
jgi:hypothetical protein